jgi:hypothetical protein
LEELTLQGSLNFNPILQISKLRLRDETLNGHENIAASAPNP